MLRVIRMVRMVFLLKATGRHRSVVSADTPTGVQYVRQTRHVICSAQDAALYRQS